MPDKHGFWIQPLTPIPCAVCGKDYASSGRYSNRSTVCRYCRKKSHKKLIEKKKEFPRDEDWEEGITNGS